MQRQHARLVVLAGDDGLDRDGERELDAELPDARFRIYRPADLVEALPADKPAQQVHEAVGAEAGSEAALWLAAESLTLEHGGEQLSRYDVKLIATTGELRTVSKPRLFDTSRLPGHRQLRLFALDALQGIGGGRVRSVQPVRGRHHVGYLFTGLWTALVALAMFGSSLPMGRWLGLLGMVSAAGVTVGMLEPAGFEPAANIVVVGYVLWLIWLALTGVFLLLSGSVWSRAPRVQPAGNPTTPFGD